MSQWILDDGRVIKLLTVSQLRCLPEGSVLYAINGEEVVKGADPLDEDTRGGFTAFGQLLSKEEPAASPAPDRAGEETESAALSKSYQQLRAAANSRDRWRKLQGDKNGSTTFDPPDDANREDIVEWLRAELDTGSIPVLNRSTAKRILDLLAAGEGGADLTALAVDCHRSIDEPNHRTQLANFPECATCKIIESYLVRAALAPHREQK